MQVNFLIAGAQKSGTTALHRFLSEHPRICMASRKEVHFFDKNKNFKISSPDYDTYHKNFPNPSDDQIVGEATPRYICWPSAPQRIKEYNPDMKLIFILRDPVERAYSQFIMEKKRGKEPFPFFVAIRLEKIRALFQLQIKKRHYRNNVIILIRTFSNRQSRFFREVFNRKRFLLGCVERNQKIAISAFLRSNDEK